MINKREKYSFYDFEIFEHTDDCCPVSKWYSYKIYSQRSSPYDEGVIEGKDGYDTAQEARFAAIGHITFMEQENKND